MQVGVNHVDIYHKRKKLKVLRFTVFHPNVGKLMWFLLHLYEKC